MFWRGLSSWTPVRNFGSFEDVDEASDMKVVVFSLAVGLLFVGVACQSPKSAAKAQPDKTAVKVDFGALSNRWNGALEQVFVENSRALAGSPYSPFAPNARPARFGGALRSPAISSFDRHVSGASSAMFGSTNLDQARLVVSIADAGLVGYTTMFSNNGKFTHKWIEDFIGDLPRGGRAGVSKLVSDATITLKAGASSGTSGEWTYEFRTIKFSDKTCFKCHADKKPGDTAAHMLYAFAKAGPSK
ncbi:MAG: hypothetical protein ABL949_00885 [Fimbriimonadaceae bacterium]